MAERKVLIIETSTEAGSVAVATGNACVVDLAFTSRDPRTGHRTESLAPAIVRALTDAAVDVRALSAVVCGAGPGGFTSLRSAASLAKGMCAALNIPLYAESSLELLAWSATYESGEGRYIAALSAGRNEWFSVDVERALAGDIIVGDTYLIGDAELRSRATELRAPLIGPGLDHDVAPRAAAAVPFLGVIFGRGPVDLDGWEPTYGRLAEAQVKWETVHGRPLSA
jgi:tRNA threonylcarbamoyladenosine biosynthesis protein TsaB